MAALGRFLPFAAFWAELLHRTTLLQCVRRESANSRRSLKDVHVLAGLLTGSFES